MGSKDIFWDIRINWADGSQTSVIVDSDDLDGLDWKTWLHNYVVKASSRPTWFQLGRVTFHSQNVRSIELMESFEKGD